MLIRACVCVCMFAPQWTVHVPENDHCNVIVAHATFKTHIQCLVGRKTETLFAQLNSIFNIKHYLCVVLCIGRMFYHFVEWNCKLHARFRPSSQASMHPKEVHVSDLENWIDQKWWSELENFLFFLQSLISRLHRHTIIIIPWKQHKWHTLTHIWEKCARQCGWSADPITSPGKGACVLRIPHTQT